MFNGQNPFGQADTKAVIMVNNPTTLSPTPIASRMARKSDSCLTPAIKGERRLRNTPIRRRSDSAKLPSLQSGRSFRIVLGASGVEGACARALFSMVLAGELVPQAQSAGHWAHDLIAQAAAR